MKLLCTNCRQHYKRYGEMPLLPGMVRDGREFSFRPISPEGLTGGPEDVDSDGRGLDNRLSPADRGKIFVKSFQKYFYFSPLQLARRATVVGATRAPGASPGLAVRRM